MYLTLYYEIALCTNLADSQSSRSMCVKRTPEMRRERSHSAPELQHYMPKENGRRMLRLKPMASQLVLDFVLRKWHRVACPTFNLDLAGPENAQVLRP